jgi:hypothetical protein
MTKQDRAMRFSRRSSSNSLLESSTCRAPQWRAILNVWKLSGQRMYVRVEVESFVYYYAQLFNGFVLSHWYVIKVNFVFPINLGSPAGYLHFGLLLIEFHFVFSCPRFILI